MSINFKSLGKTLANVGTNAFLGMPIFTDVKKAGDVVSTIPLVGTATRVSQIILEVQHTGELLDLTGEQKRRLAIAKVTPVILDDNFLHNTKSVDNALLMQGISEIVQGFYDILNSVEQK